MNYDDYDMYVGNGANTQVRKVCILLFICFIACLCFTVSTYARHTYKETQQAVEREASKFASAFEDINTIIGER